MSCCVYDVICNVKKNFKIIFSFLLFSQLQLKAQEYFFRLK